MATAQFSADSTALTTLFVKCAPAMQYKHARRDKPRAAACLGVAVFLWALSLQNTDSMGHKLCASAAGLISRCGQRRALSSPAAAHHPVPCSSPSWPQGFKHRVALSAAADQGLMCSYLPRHTIPKPQGMPTQVSLLLQRHNSIHCQCQRTKTGQMYSRT